MTVKRRGDELPDYSEPPALFPWGRAGLPGELREFLIARDRQLRHERGEPLDDLSSGPVFTVGDVSTVGAGLGHFPAAAVADVAAELHRKLTGDRATAGAPKGQGSKVPAVIADWTFALVSFCALYGRPVPMALLWLVFDALGLSEGRPSPAMLGQLVGLEGVDQVEKFVDAARRDGTADRERTPLSAYALARAVDVTRDTVQRWRQRPQYQQLRRRVAASDSSWT